LSLPHPSAKSAYGWGTQNVIVGGPPARLQGQSAGDTGRLRGGRFGRKSLFYSALRGRGRCVERAGAGRFAVADGEEIG